jgi:hypothetical protein
MTVRTKSSNEAVLDCGIPLGTGEQSFLTQIRYGAENKALSDGEVYPWFAYVPIKSCGRTIIGTSGGQLQIVCTGCRKVRLPCSGAVNDPTNAVDQ